MINTHFLFSLSQQRKSKIFFFFKDDFHYYKHEKEDYAQVFEDMLGQQPEPNLHGPRDVAGVAATTEPDEDNRQMNEAELRHELAERERQMRTFQGPEGATTDQWRVYKEAIQVLEASRAPLRLCLQTSAGTGTSSP